MTYQQAAAQKLKQLQEGLPPEWMIEQAANGKRRGDTLQLVQDHLSPNEQAITEANALELLRRLQQGDVSSQEVVTAFVHRAYVSHQYVSIILGYRVWMVQVDQETTTVSCSKDL